ncbi:MAG: aldose 1-epimerase family protein [Oscillospiraceae bacterium]|nr:aldose 1-epimerase family protein [Oscillospiraceae bacterium]
MNKYIGNTLQLYGVEETRLCGGRGDGMRILRVRNNCGLAFEISLDRCGDISRLSLRGDNFGLFAGCGYVAPSYYDGVGLGFLKSFTAGFITTCGLTAVGSPCTDEGVDLPLHGTVSHIPCESFSYSVDEKNITIKVTVRDAALFSHHLVLEREYVCAIDENVLHMTDTVKNLGSKETPLQILYHCNMGYPLLSENAIVTIPSSEVKPRNAHAAVDLEDCLRMERPQAGYEEKCYYHTLSGKATVSIFNPDINKGLNLSYDTAELPFFTEWKMMGEHDYALGLEPGNACPEGRDWMRKNGLLEFLKPGAEKVAHMTFEFVEKK